MAVAEGSLAKAPDEETKCKIGKAFFGETFLEKGGVKAFEDYFRYYNNEIDWLPSGMSPDGDQIPGIVAKTHHDFITITAILREKAGSRRGEIREKLKQVVRHFDAKDKALNRTIDAALRLWLQINVRDDTSGTPVPEAHWDEDMTLTEFLAQLFPVEDWDLDPSKRRLDPYFNAANMVEICGLKIIWTDSLEDHLRLERREDKKVLYIFPHKQNLQALLAETVKASGHQSPLPVTVLRETIQTLDLLFPFWDERTKAFLKREGQSFHNIMSHIDHGRRLHLLDFPHWKVRILDVHEEIYQSPPVSWAQLWLDRRNPQQFWTFWIALAILALTMISTIASVVSMATGIAQMKLQLEQSRQPQLRLPSDFEK